MKLTQQTIDTLRSLGEINDTVAFKAGNRILHKPAENSTPLVEVILEQEFPSDFYIYNIHNLVNFAKMMDEPSLTIDGTHAHLKDRSGRKAKIALADPYVLRNIPDYSKKIQLPTREVELTVSDSDWKSLTRSTSIVDAAQIAFVGDGTTVSISTYDVNDKSKDSFAIPVGESSLTFNMIFNLTSLRLMPGDYTVTLSFKGIAEFRRDNVTYWIAASDKSKYN